MNRSRQNVLRVPTLFIRIAGLVLAFASFVTSPVEAEETVPHRTFVIGTTEAAPFAMKQADGQWIGISIDLWNEIARRRNLACEFREMPVDDLLKGVADGTLDAAVAAITITADREKAIDFSQPFYTSDLTIAAPTRFESVRWQSVLRSLFSWGFLQVLLALAGVLLLAGFAVWLFERRHNREQFGGPPLHGIASGFWWSAVTMTTVGYGDKAPRTPGGRIVAIIWMFTSVCIISSFTASITSSLTISHFNSLIRGVQDLPKVRVGTVAGTTGAAYLREAHISSSLYPTAEQALDALTDGNIDAMVFDAPILKYLVHQRARGQIDVLPLTLLRQNYGIALRENSPLREPVDVTLLQILAEPLWKDIVFRYLGD